MAKNVFRHGELKVVEDTVVLKLTHNYAPVVEEEVVEVVPEYTGVEEALSLKNTDIRIFGKPFTRKNRRMAVALTYSDKDEEDIQTLRDRAIKAANLVKVIENK